MCGEERECLVGGRDSEEVLAYEIVGLRTRSRSDPLRRPFAIVFGTAKCHMWAEQRPVCTWSTVRHTNASRIYHSKTVHATVERHMRMSADNDVGIHARDKGAHAGVRRACTDDFLVAAWRTMTEQHPTQPVHVEPDRLLESGKEVALPPRDPLRTPLDVRTRPLRQWKAIVGGNEAAVCVAPNKARSRNPHQQIDRLPRQGSRRYVTADNQDVGRLTLDLHQHHLKRGQVPVHI